MRGEYLEDVRFTLRRYKALAERAFDQIDEEQLHWAPDPEDNSVATLVKHLAGNMRSRWSDFLTTDGEKPDRARDQEFEDTLDAERNDILKTWERGWTCVFSALESLGPDDLEKAVTIRGREHTVLQAIDRQLAHYAYHVGQIVFLARMLAGPERWRTLSIARGQSQQYVPGERI